MTALVCQMHAGITADTFTANITHDYQPDGGSVAECLARWTQAQ